MKYSKSQQKIHDAYKVNPLYWGKVFLQVHFRGPTPVFHLDIMNNALEHRYLAVAAPRESAKSTVLAFLYPLHCICFQKKHFILIVSNTYSKACTTLETIKKEIKENSKVMRYKIEMTKNAEGDTIFRHLDGFETRVLCKGHEQMGSVRGEKFGAYRPDLIIGDDIEDDELVKNPVRRFELQEVFDQALIPAGDKEVCQYLFIGTILHDDSLMAKLVSKTMYLEYKKLIFRGLYRNFDTKELESLWDYKWSVDDLLKMRKEKPGVFAKEIQNNPVSGLMQKFFKEDFRYWTIENMQYILFDKEAKIVAKGEMRECKAAIACDLAWEENKQNDFSVILPAFLTPQNDILVDTYTCKRGLRPSEMWEILVAMEGRLRGITQSTVPIGFEKAKLEKVMKFLLRQYMAQHNKFLYFKEILWDKDKISRIETRLQPRYNQHSVYHKRDMGDLENQLLRFPSAAHDDLPDALQGIVQILEYPKQKPREAQVDNEFEWFRKKAIEEKHPKYSKYVFGGKKWFAGIPFKQSYR